MPPASASSRLSSGRDSGFKVPKNIDSTQFNSLSSAYGTIDLAKEGLTIPLANKENSMKQQYLALQKQDMLIHLTKQMDDTLNSQTDWINIQSIVRHTFQTLYDLF